MSLIHPGDLDVRILNCDIDEDYETKDDNYVPDDLNKTTMMQTLRHVLTKRGGEVSFDYVIQGPKHAIRVHFDGQQWRVIAHEENDGVQPPQPDMHAMSDAPNYQGVPPEDAAQGTQGDSGSVDEPVDNDGEPKDPPGDGTIPPISETDEKKSEDGHSTPESSPTSDSVAPAPGTQEEVGTTTPVSPANGFGALDAKAEELKGDGILHNEPGR